MYLVIHSTNNPGFSLVHKMMETNVSDIGVFFSNILEEACYGPYMQPIVAVAEVGGDNLILELENGRQNMFCFTLTSI